MRYTIGKFMTNKYFYKVPASILLLSILLTPIFHAPSGNTTSTIEHFVLNYLPVMLLFVGFIALTNRLLLSSFLSFSFASGLILINSIKYEILGKTLIPLDFFLVKQIIKSPSLYLSYVPPITYGALVLFIVISVIFIRYESVIVKLSIKSIALRSVIVLAIFSFFVQTTQSKSPVSSLYTNSYLKYKLWSPEDNVRTSGFFFTLIRMSSELDFNIPRDVGDLSLIYEKIRKRHNQQATNKITAHLPDIMVIQNESFYDMRQRQIQIDESAYSNYDHTAHSSSIYGSLKVPTCGGNTVKTEFSFLTGIAGEVLPAACEYPYRLLVKEDIWSIAWYLKSLGYKTIAIHPHTRSFWNRNIALPLLGFDEFIDENYFSEAQNDGHYISDKAIAQKIKYFRQRLESPVFIFAITMENHGPWLIDSSNALKSFKISSELQGEDRRILNRYLHHVSNAGMMAKQVVNDATSDRRPCLVAFYGDHAPGFVGNLANIPLKKGESDMNTPYFIWKNFGVHRPTFQNVSADYLASLILDEAGINNDVYFAANSFMRDLTGGDLANLAPNNELRKSYTQLLYNNVNGKTHNFPFHPRTSFISSLQNGRSADLQIKDYGPKTLVAGIGGNIQKDGSTAIWVTGDHLNERLIIYANETPLKTNLSAGATAITATIPTRFFDRRGMINIRVEDSETMQISNLLSIIVN